MSRYRYEGATSSRLLQHKDKVQISVVFRGREMAHIEEGRNVMEAVIADLIEFGKVEAQPTQNGRTHDR